MSSRATPFAAALALCAAAVLHAQSPSREADSLLQRARTLDSAMLARVRSVDSLRRSLVRPVPPVDVRHGPVHVRTERELAPRVEQAVASVASLVAVRGGTLLATRVAEHLTTITRDSTRSMFGMVPVIAINADTAKRWSPIGQRQVPKRASAEQLADALASIAEEFAMQGVDSTLAAWVMLGRAPIRPAGTGELADTYIELATTESIALRRCRARDVAACLDALGVDSMPGSRLERWYAPDDYRAVLRTVAPSHDSTAVAAWVRCRERLDDAGCRVAARAIEDGRVPLPLSAAARFTFLRDVLDAGGVGSFDRLVTGSGSIRDRLAFAANEPLDQAVMHWLDGVERSRPDRMHVPAGLIIASLGWSAAILGLALVRRTSWV